MKRLVRRIMASWAPVKGWHIIRIGVKQEKLEPGIYNATVKGVHEEPDGSLTILLHNVEKMK